jgi:hypothetical protein
MALSKLDLALVAVAAAGLIWIEHNHRVVIGSLAAVEAAPPAASVCPKTDDIPFSPECIKFIGGGASPDIAPQPPAASAILFARIERGAETRTPPCPSRDESAPDGDSCFR